MGAIGEDSVRSLTTLGSHSMGEHAGHGSGQKENTRGRTQAVVSSQGRWSGHTRYWV